MTASPPRFGDAELSVLDYLEPRMDRPDRPWQGSTDFPPGEPTTPWIVVHRYGGNYRPPHIDYARFSIESWSRDRFGAQAALQEALGHLLIGGKVDTAPRTRDGVALPRITKTFVESGPQYFPDGLTDCHRWISTVAVYMRALDG